jgi:YfiH family protein
MPKKNIKENQGVSNSAIELLTWPSIGHKEIRSQKNSVVAFQTTSAIPSNITLTQTNFAFASFNLGLHVNDNIDSVEKNRTHLQQHIQKSSPNKIVIQWLDQVHGNDVVEIIQSSEDLPQADACITRNKYVALAIMTADCLPILLCNKQRTEIAAIHGGWKPLASNIIENTLLKMECESKDVIAWLGPCIGNTAFEVGEEVKLAFTKQNIEFSQAFLLQENGKYLADLHFIAKLQLSALNIKEVTVLDECTYNLSNKYYSYRREAVTGRMASLICLLD